MKNNTSLAALRPPTWQFAVVVAVLLAVAAFLSWQTWRSGQPIALPDAAHAKLACASYTPSHDGHTLTVAEQRALVVSDLKLLAERFNCVRTYSVSEGLEDVPKVARALGLKVMLGLWISSHGPSNDREIAHGVALANQYADVVTSIIVGNEVLLRREQTGAQMRALLERVRAGTTVPVTYADVWEFWLRNPELAEATTFVTVHILPYWEDNPIGIDHALDHVRNIYAKVQQAFPGRTIFIGETGWPSAGRPRLQAAPSPINEARFIREFVAYAEREKIPYNLIEAFDQPWKRVQEGTVGGYWGLYDAAGATKFPFVGPVSAQPQWRWLFLAALGGAALFLIGGALLSPKVGAKSFVILGIAGYIAGAVLCSQWQYLSAANRSLIEWLTTSAWAIAGWMAYIHVCVALAHWIEGAALLRAASIASVVRSWGHGATLASDTSRLLGVLRLFILLGTAYVCLALTYEGRGRDFPLTLLALPTMVFVLLEWLAPTRGDSTSEYEELLLAACIALTALYVAWIETLVNKRALALSALCLLMAGAQLIGHFRCVVASRRAHPHQRAQQQTGAA